MSNASLTHKQKRKLLKYFVPSLKRYPNRPVIISEGDSWFSFPLHANVIDHLDRMAGRKVNLLRLEKSGDEFLNIMSGKQRKKLRRYLERYPVQALLISGGGNDIVGSDLESLLRPKTASRSWEKCIEKNRVRRRIGQLRDAHLDLIDLRDDVNSSCEIYTHGYDYAIPNGKAAKPFPGIRVGPWLKPYLEAKAITDPSDQQRIINFLIDQFNEMLADLSRGRADVTHISTPGTLSSSDWSDELHPSRKGFEKVAEAFRGSLRFQFPGTF